MDNELIVIEDKPQAGSIAAAYKGVINEFSERDSHMATIDLIRKGKIDQVAPGLFPPTGDFTSPIIANHIDIASRDMAEMLAPLPFIQVLPPGNKSSDAAKNQAATRTLIAQSYTKTSALQNQMYNACDHYVSYGMVALKVDPDWENQTSIIKYVPPMGLYYGKDAFGRIKTVFHQMSISKDELLRRYPDYKDIFNSRASSFKSSSKINVVFYQDKDWDALLVVNAGDTGDKNLVLDYAKNPVGELRYSFAERPGVTKIPRGQFDDMVAPYLAKDNLARLELQRVDLTINAPIAVPDDVQDVTFGPNEIVRSREPDKIRRIALGGDNSGLVEQQQLEREMNRGSRFPDARTGNSDASIITGKGIEALMGGYDSQVKTHQDILSAMLERTISIAFKLDEVLFGKVKKKAVGLIEGKATEVEYIPSKDIAGNYSVDIRYGVFGSLNMNSWLQWSLQAKGSGLVSKSFIQTNAPVVIDSAAEERQINIEMLTDSLRTSVQGYVQTIPVIAQQGGDPSVPIQVVVDMIKGINKGDPFVEVVSKAFAPKPPPEPAAPAVDELGNPVAGDPGGQLPEGLMANGLMQGVAPGQQGQLPGGRPDMMTLLSSLGADGQGRSSVSIKQQTAI